MALLAAVEAAGEVRMLTDFTTGGGRGRARGGDGGMGGWVEGEGKGAGNWQGGGQGKFWAARRGRIREGGTTMIPTL